jgi:PAS domain S-box-containing protein
MKYALSHVIDTLDGLVWAASADGLVDFVNRRWLEYTGFGIEQARGQGWQKAIHEEDLPALLADGAASRSSSEPHDTEVRMRRFDGEYRWFLIRALPLTDAAGEVVGWCGLNIDIEDRKRAEQGLRERERELRQLLDRIPGFVAIADSQGRHEYASTRTLAYTHNTLEKISGLGFVGSVHPDEQASVRDLWLSCVARGEAMDVVHRMRRFDGVYRWFHTRVEPFRDENGEIFRWYGLLTDIDDQRRAEETLHQREQELSAAMQVATLAQLSASIAHEISQPLSGILTNASTGLRMLAGESPNVEGALETARRTIRDANRAAEVITRLRALFARKNGATEQVDLNEAVREVIALLRSQIQSGRVNLRTEFHDDLPAVAGDRIQLQQVILNLLLNAIEAMSDIDDRPRQLLVRTERENGDRVRFSVQDSGVGLPADAVDRFFEAFYTTKPGGMGIGLSVSRSIIERHHGSLQAAANDGPGATFSFSISSEPPGTADARNSDTIQTAVNTETARLSRNA